MEEDNDLEYDEVKPDDWPVAVTLRFRTTVDRNRFMNGLSGGFGANHCVLEWPYGKWSEEERISGKAFEECDIFGVTTYDD